MTLPSRKKPHYLAENPSPQLRAILGWIDKLDHLDVDAAHAYVTDDVVYEFYPLSLGNKPFSKEEFKKHHSTYIAPDNIGFKTTVLDVIESTGKVFINAESLSDVDGLSHEYNIAFVIEDEKIKKVEMFLDAPTIKQMNFKRRGKAGI